MAQLDTLKLLLDSPDVDDAILQFHLDRAKDIICNLRNTDIVESKYINTQTEIAIEMFNKMGAEGETSHGENGISRTYDASDVSKSLLDKIIPVATTPFSTVTVVV